MKLATVALQEHFQDGRSSTKVAVNLKNPRHAEIKQGVGARI